MAITWTIETPEDDLMVIAPVGEANAEDVDAVMRAANAPEHNHRSRRLWDLRGVKMNFSVEAMFSAAEIPNGCTLERRRIAAVVEERRLATVLRISRAFYIHNTVRLFDDLDAAKAWLDEPDDAGLTSAIG